MTDTATKPSRAGQGLHFCDEPGCDFSTEWGAALSSHRRHAHSGEREGASTEPSPQGAVGEGIAPTVEEAAPAPPPGPSEEKRPRLSEPSKPASERAKGLWGRIKEGDRTKPSKAKVVRTRQSTAELFEFAWAQGGNFLIASGRDIPVGRILALQAPMVGATLDEVVRDTVIDAPLQFLIRQSDRAKLLGAVVMPPLLVGAMERNPELAPTLMPMLRAVMLPMLEELAKAAKKAKADEKKLFKAMEEIEGALPPELIERAKAEGVHPVDALLASIFAPPETAEPVPEPEPAVA